MKYMKRLSQREILQQEGALRSLGRVVKAGTKALGKKISPSLYSDISNISKVIKNNFRSPKQLINGLKKERPEVVADITDINIVKKGLIYVADFKVKLRDPNTRDVVDQLIPIRNIAIKEVSGDNGVSYEMVADSKNIDKVIEELSDKYPDIAEAIKAFGEKVLRSQVNQPDDKETSAGEKDTDDKELSPIQKAFKNSRDKRDAALDDLKNTPPLPSAEEPPPLPSAEEPPPLPSAEEPPPLPSAEEPVAQPDAEESIPKLFDANDEEIQVGDYFIEPEELAIGIKSWGRVDSIDDRIITLTLIGSSHGDGEAAELTHKQWQEYKDTIEKSNGPEDGEMLVSEKSQKSLLKHLQSMSR
jgi:hypothetical protein